MENETKKSKLTAKDILAKTGPGIIMAAAAVGTGTVTTSAILGARYEYGMIWMVILALFMRGIYMRSAYTAQVVLGMPILDCINKFYGKALCAIAVSFVRLAALRTRLATSPAAEFLSICSLGLTGRLAVSLCRLFVFCSSSEGAFTTAWKRA